MADRMTKEAAKKQKPSASESSSHPSSPDEAPRGAMQTDRSPRPENKHARRTATKRLLTKQAVDGR
jgi:hypothetical protein